MVSAEAAAIHGAVAACRCYGDRTVSVGSSCERLCPLMSLVWAGWGSDFLVCHAATVHLTVRRERRTP